MTGKKPCLSSRREALARSINTPVMSWSFVAPALLLVLTFHLLPMIDAVKLGFTDTNAISGKGTWVGVDNYRAALADSSFRNSLVTTGAFFLIKVPLQMAIGLALALFVQGRGRVSGFVRTLVLVPTVTSLVVVTTLFGLIYHPSNGLANGIINAAHIPAQPFLTSEHQALPAIALMLVWRDVGFTMLLFLAGLSSISPELNEACRIDGASSWQAIRHITVPLLAPTSALILLIEGVNAFKVFAPVLLLTDGGPAGSTRVVVHYIYDTAFRFGQMGYASAMAVLLLIALSCFAALQMVIRRRSVET